MRPFMQITSLSRPEGYRKEITWYFDSSMCVAMLVKYVKTLSTEVMNNLHIQ